MSNVCGCPDIIAIELVFVLKQSINDKKNTHINKCELSYASTRDAYKNVFSNLISALSTVYTKSYNAVPAASLTTLHGQNFIKISRIADTVVVIQLVGIANSTDAP